jgi:hypothetical protein
MKAAVAYGDLPVGAHLWTSEVPALHYVKLFAESDGGLTANAGLAQTDPKALPRATAVFEDDEIVTVDVSPEFFTRSADELATVREGGYRVYDLQPHLTLDIPDTGLTVSVKLRKAGTLEPRRMTFAFLPKVVGGIQCVDITQYDGPRTVKNGSDNLPVQSIIVRGLGNVLFNSGTQATNPVLLTTVLIE